MIKELLKPARKIHKYLGYLLFLQLLAWLLGGLVMSAIPLEMVHGKHLASRTLASPFTTADYSADLQLMLKDNQAVKRIEFTHFANQPVLKVLSAQNTSYYDGKTGLPLSAPSEQAIIEQAKAHYTGSGDVANSYLHKTAPREAGFKNNVWQITFDDFVSTTLYLSAESGELITIRSSIWRIFDFFWMLHIMDYDEREDFNNPLLISFALTSVLFCLSGILLLLQSPPWRKLRPR
ncbi:hypothetical protein ACSLBF_01305 [Pseudoalteromonas sp. T1lg65]|uniref:hypothetical protein n=1 Tax=Pseudoalteromonas sp. T1lg65 TaxID=2077101 RepID=UPI003F7A08CA